MKSFIAVLFLVLTTQAQAEQTITDDGTTNPEEMTLDYFANTYDFKAGKSTACVYGYYATKSGDHALAKKIFDKCVGANVDAALVWQSYMAQNGFGQNKDLGIAAEWDKRSADRGYKVGQFNYGLSLLRGYGVEQDVIAGKALIDQSAAQGFAPAQDLAQSGYDPQTAIPDADERKYW